jgi:hypothetical protein
MTPTIGPARFVMDIIEGGVPKTKAGHDLGDELSGHGYLFRGKCGLLYDKFLLRVQVILLS